MKNNFSLKLNIYDIIVGLFALLISIGSLVIFAIINNKQSGDRIVSIQYQNTIIEEINLEQVSEDYVITLYKEDYPDLLGDFYIEINKEKGVRAINETCPNHVCEKYGYINKSGRTIVCIPNGIIISIYCADDDTITVG